MRSLELTLGGLKEGSRTGFSAIDPRGMSVADDDPTTTDIAVHTDPLPGVREIAVDSRRTSAPLDNPYRLNVSAFAARFDPAPVTVPEAEVGTAVDASWTVANTTDAADGALKGGTLGSSRTADRGGGRLRRAVGLDRVRLVSGTSGIRPDAASELGRWGALRHHHDPCRRHPLVELPTGTELTVHRRLK
ncbi:hypothetical protein [Streptomyces sp. MA5143a]|uniref:hypothetical protein n=1 Tax=Streptomyces sp. MA5143a TaxID=2083010 RepID=UPI000D19E627|nr:hypothetical protein [Streptomyces sp. MA5143a]